MTNINFMLSSTEHEEDFFIISGPDTESDLVSIIGSALYSTVVVDWNQCGEEFRK